MSQISMRPLTGHHRDSRVLDLGKGEIASGAQGERLRESRQRALLAFEFEHIEVLIVSTAKTRAILTSNP